MCYPQDHIDIYYYGPLNDTNATFNIVTGFLNKSSSLISLAFMCNIICMMYQLKLTLMLILKDTNEMI